MVIWWAKMTSDGVARCAKSREVVVDYAKRSRFLLLSAVGSATGEAGKAADWLLRQEGVAVGEG
jgi:hypothetical protein